MFRVNPSCILYICEYISEWIYVQTMSSRKVLYLLAISETVLVSSRPSFRSSSRRGNKREFLCDAFYIQKRDTLYIWVCGGIGTYM